MFMVTVRLEVGSVGRQATNIPSPRLTNKETNDITKEIFSIYIVDENGKNERLALQDDTGTGRESLKESQLEMSHTKLSTEISGGLVHKK